MRRALLILLLASFFANGCSQIGRIEEKQELAALDSVFQHGDYANAIRRTQDFLEHNPNSSEGWKLLGWAFMRSHKYVEALPCFNRAVELNPKNDNAWVGKGAAHRRHREPDRARESYLTAIDIKPDNPEAYSSLSTIEFLEGNYSDAVRYGEKAWEMRKDDPTTPTNLALAYHVLGDTVKRNYFVERTRELDHRSVRQLEDIIAGRAKMP